MRNLQWSFRNIRTIFLKEMLETIRDRRTLMITVFLPIILYPLLILGMSQLIVLQIGSVEKKSIRIAFSGHFAQLQDMLKQDRRFDVIEVPSDQIRVLLEKDDVDIGIEVTSGFEKQLQKAVIRPLPRVTVFYTETSEKSNMAIQKLDSSIYQCFRDAVKMRVEKLGGSMSMLRPFRIVLKNVARAQDEGAFHFGRILALLLVLMAVSLTLYPAIDMAAGEKERGTMETLLISPAHRMEIILGKYLAIATIAMVGSLLNLASMGLTFGQFASTASNLPSESSRRSGNFSWIQEKNSQDIVREEETTLWGHSGEIKWVNFWEGMPLSENKNISGNPSQNEPLHHAGLDTAFGAISVDQHGNIIQWNFLQEQGIMATLPESPISFAIARQKGYCLFGTTSGNLWRFETELKKVDIVWKTNEPILYLACSDNGNRIVFVDRANLYILDVSQAEEEKNIWKQTARIAWNEAYKTEQIYALVFSPANDRIALCSKPSVLILDANTGNLLKALPYEVSCAAFSPEGNYLACGDNQGTLTLWDVEMAKLVASIPETDISPDVEANTTKTNKDATKANKKKNSKFSDIKPHEGKITAIAFDEDGKTIASSGVDGTIGIWKFSRQDEKITLADILYGHEAEVLCIALFGHHSQCISGGRDGLVKLWKYATPKLSFSISWWVVVMVLLLLMPLIGLFSAVSLALSSFAKSYKESQYYITPIVVFAMPMAMVGLIPAVKLTESYCFIPVAGVVLLYKDLFMGQVDWLHIGLVFFSTFIYATLALVWAMRLFEKESIVSRGSEEIGWEFWNSKEKKQDVFTFNQACTIFFVVMALYYFAGRIFSQQDFITGHIATQILFLVVVPLLLAGFYRLDIKKVFHISRPGLRHIVAAVLMAFSGLFLARELSIYQREFLFGDSEYLKQFGEMVQKLIDGSNPILLLVAFALTPGICEEFLFRGMILSSFKRHARPAYAIFLVAALFAFMHLNFANFTFYLVMGLILGYIVWKTGSIFVGMAAHVINNMMGFMLEPLAKGTPLWDSLSQINGHLPVWALASALVIFMAGVWILQEKRR